MRLVQRCIRDLARERRRIAAASVAGVVLGLAVWALRTPLYRSDASLLPQQRGASSQINGLAAQLGISASSSDPSQSPAFYAALLRSRAVLDSAVLTEYAGADGSRRTLIDWYGFKGMTGERALQMATDALRDRLTVLLVPQAGVVTFSVEAPDPLLARAVASRMPRRDCAIRTERAADAGRRRKTFHGSLAYRM